MSEPSPAAHSGHNVDTSLPPVAPASPWARIKDHKIIQWAVGYLAAALALTHSEELIAHAYGWPESIAQILIALLGIGLPVAVTLAWYHGHRASRHVTGAEATIIAVLLLIGAGLLWALVRPHEPSVAQSVAEHATAPTTPPVSSITAAPVITSSTAPSLLPAPTPGKPRIAILPFENLSPDPANAFFAEGLHEEILATLAQRAPGLEVISRTTMLTYRQKPKPVTEMAKELGATHVIEGSVQRAGNRVRLTLQLIAAKTDDHIWAHDYNRTLTDALTLQSDVANEVASQLAVKLASNTSGFTTRDPKAYDLYLKARLQRERGSSAATPLEVLQNIEQLFSDALVRDPDFARAYAQRAGMRMLQTGYNYVTPQQAMPLVQKDVEAAERLAPDDPEVLFAKADYLTLLQRDPTSAVAALDAAASDGLDPYFLAVSARIYQAAGRFDEAIQHTQHALALDPKNRSVYEQLIRALMYARRPVEGLRFADMGSAEFPELSPWRAYIIWANTGAGPPTATPYGTPIAEITANVDVRSVDASFFPLRLEHRYREMADYLGRATRKAIRGHPGFGDYPVAALQGWTHMLLGDRAAAARDGHEVLEFVAKTEETKWNRAVLTLLTAEGNTFTGDRPHAITAAGKALRLSQSIPERQVVPPLVASVYAWSGAGDDAAALLEQLSTQIPMALDCGPATITRDPLYTVPLAGNARYKALQAKLEAQMAATKLE